MNVVHGEVDIFFQEDRINFSRIVDIVLINMLIMLIIIIIVAVFQYFGNYEFLKHPVYILVWVMIDELSRY